MELHSENYLFLYNDTIWKKEKIDGADKMRKRLRYKYIFVSF